MRFLVAFACIIATAFGQLAPLYGNCYGSTQCMGASICMQQQCICPSGCSVIGGVCSYGGGVGYGGIGGLGGLGGLGGYGSYGSYGSYGGLGMGMLGSGIGSGIGSYYGGMGLGQMGYGGLGYGGISAISSSTTVTYAYPGQSCYSGMTCMGNSFCNQGSCCCPSGYIVSGQSCIYQSAGGYMGGLGGFGGLNSLYGGIGHYGSGFGVGMYGGGIGIGSGIGIGGGCQSACTGGAICSLGACNCPTGLVMCNSMCLPMQVYPGATCYSGQSCMGGSFCQGGSCCCQSGYTVYGGSCVAMQLQQQLAVPLQIAQQTSLTTSLVYPGSPCGPQTQCVTGATCMGTCRCSSAYFQFGTSCVLRHRAKETKKNETEPIITSAN